MELCLFPIKQYTEQLEKPGLVIGEELWKIEHLKGNFLFSEHQSVDQGGIYSLDDIIDADGIDIMVFGSN